MLSKNINKKKWNLNSPDDTDEALCTGFVPDLKRMAGTEIDKDNHLTAQCIIICWSK
jgi:hypothetical protein